MCIDHGSMVHADLYRKVVQAVAEVYPVVTMLKQVCEQMTQDPAGKLMPLCQCNRSMLTSRH